MLGVHLVTDIALKCLTKGQAQGEDTWEPSQIVPLLPTPLQDGNALFPCGYFLLVHCKMRIRFYFEQHKWPSDAGVFWRMVVYAIGKQRPLLSPQSGRSGTISGTSETILAPQLEQPC